MASGHARDGRARQQRLESAAGGLVRSSGSELPPRCGGSVRCRGRRCASASLSLLSLLLLTPIAPAAPSGAKKKQPFGVRARLISGWSRTPPGAQSLEWLRDVDPADASSFLLRSVGRGGAAITDDAGGLADIDVRFKSSVARTFHELLVRNVYYSPRIELLRSLERIDRRKHGAACASGAAWALLFAANGSAPIAACDAEQLHNALAAGADIGGGAGGGSTEGFRSSEVDLELRRASAGGGAAVIYGSLSAAGALSLTPLLREVVALSEQASGWRVIFRHADGPDADAGDSDAAADVLTGYGFELGIKSSEYKTHADDEGKDSESEEGKREGDEVAAASTATQADLEEDDLLKVGDDIDALLRDAEIRDIGVQAVATVKASKTPLLQLMRLSQNFPAHVVGLARSAVPEEVREGVREMNQWMREGAEVFSVNGRIVRPDQSELSVLPMINMLQPVFVAVERMVRTGVSETIACELLRESDGSKLPERVDWRSPFLPEAVYIVTKDRKALRWGEDLQHLMYAFPGQLAPVRLPLYTVVFVFDPAELSELRQAGELLAQMPLPISLRFVMVPDGSIGARAPTSWDERLLGEAPTWLKASAPSDAASSPVTASSSTLIAAAFSELLSGGAASHGALPPRAQGAKAARSFAKVLAARAAERIEAAERRWPDGVGALEEVRGLWRQSLPKEVTEAEADAAWERMLRSLHDRGGHISNSTQYAATVGVPLPSVLVNGKLMLKGAYDGQQGIYPIIGYEQQVFQRALFTGQLSSMEDVEELVASQGLLSAYHPDIVPKVAQRGGEEGMPGEETTASYVQWPAEEFLKLPWLESTERPLAEGGGESEEHGRLNFFHVTVLRSVAHSYLLSTFAGHLLSPDRSAVTSNKRLSAPPFASRWVALVDASAAPRGEAEALAALARCVHGVSALQAGKEGTASQSRPQLEVLRFLGQALPAAAGDNASVLVSAVHVHELCDLAISRSVPDTDHRNRLSAAVAADDAAVGEEVGRMLVAAAQALDGSEGSALWVCNGRKVALAGDGQPVSPSHVQALELMEAQYDVTDADSDEEQQQAPGQTAPIEEKEPVARAKALHEWLAEDGVQNGKTLPDQAHGLVAAIRSAALSTGRNERFSQPAEVFERAPAALRLTLPPARPDAASPIQVYGILDPVSETAQSASAVLALFGMTFNAEVNLVLNPRARHTEYPLKRYYREVIRWPAQLADGRATASVPGGDGLIEGKAHFSLATKHVLTAAVHVLPTWLVTAYEAEHDMDNLRQVDVGDGKWCDTTYQLRQLYVEGQALILGEDGWPVSSAKGLQIDVTRQGAVSAAGGGNEEPADDTIVMGNLGYFQVHGNPGVYEVNLKTGLSNDTFAIASAKQLAVSSYITPPYQLRVNLLPGRRHKDLFEQGGHFGGGGFDGGAGELAAGLWSSLASMFGFGAGGGDSQKSAEVSSSGSDGGLPTIHIFSVASGHLYEKLLSIMILSVRNNTKCPLHFWFIDNFLSPKFKAFIPSLAKRYEFAFDFVTYKWPSWLNPQSEKQRLIWAYKVLFLDVLFPQGVPKVLFIDADQVVRADVRELWDTDLQGKVYGFVPMGNSNPDTEGFRFWKQGYWKNHLQDLPYHISALFVVDLVEFRRTSIGDALRGVYNQLSRDPNSLSNLEQDLINFAQHQVPIHSLPDEWLWCETWCSQESKLQAKTIDLCQNPLTKEPKIVMARRIIKEWQIYHDEVQRFQDAMEQSRLSGSHGEGGDVIGDAISVLGAAHAEL